MNLFGILFGWRKASKCKKLIKRVQCRLKLLRNKRYSIIRHLREDIIQLLKNGQEQSAYGRVEQLCKDQSIMAAYDLLDHFCEFIIINLPYIRQNKDCPNDINEAASSLLYASARFGDLPELHKLRKLFGERYGHRFAMAAVELLPGNLVNRQIIEKLSVKSVPDDVKFKLMKEITRENSLELDPPKTDSRFELQQNQVFHRCLEICDFEWDKKVSDTDIKSINRSTGLQDSNHIDMQGNTRSEVSLSDSTILVIASKVEEHGQLDPLDEPGLVQDRISCQSISGLCSTSRSSLQNKMETVKVATSESSFQLSERNIVYLDDVEEVQPSIQEDGNYKDQRLFMFKSTYPPREKNIGDNRTSLSDLYHDLYNDDHAEPCGSSGGKTNSRSTNKRRKSSRKRLKRRYLYLENQMCQSPASVSSSIKDAECALYYNDSWHHRRKNKNMSAGESRSSSYTSHQKELSSPQQRCKSQRSPRDLCCEKMGDNHLSHKSKYQRRAKGRCGFNCDMNAECSLEHPCYFCTSDDKDDWESLTPRQMSGKTKSLESPYRKLQQGKSAKRGSFSTTEITNSRANSARNKVTSNNMKHQDTDSVSRSHKSRRDYQGTCVTHEVEVSQNQRQNERRIEVEEEQVSDCQESYASSRGSCTREMSPWTQKTPRPPYLRAATMPPERPKEKATDQFFRSASFQCQQRDVSNSNSSSSSSCRHIHPKLPDYDDLEAKFAALKKEHSEK
ncbi:protein of unknown function DUF292 [Macleaya cordata]|uniref:Vacuolar protein sorting-associated protein Ist1 n=1 Tax=Macleaya cordata TaxID=56857 RepID=A0A200PQS5_MACCD|nr:protein of unknown function DUF292 [Macleaya cordata]